ncbi:MAG: ComEC/Rec2 family competence protein [Bacteroidales bacterium]|jgi:competence protein ComEC|nr:ComEC/Rec2 family competence protein [Bacteroidales bacterium]
MDLVKGGDIDNTRQAGNSPLLLYTVSYITGILISPHLNIPPTYSAIIAYSATLATFLISLASIKLKDFRYSKIIKLLLLLSMCLAGNFNNSIRLSSTKNKQISLLVKEKKTPLKLIVKNSVKINRNSSSTFCFSKEYNEKILLYIDKKYPAADIHIGDTIILNYSGSSVERLAINGNNGWVDYLKSKGVLSFGYVKSGEFRVIKPRQKRIPDYLLNKKSSLIQKLNRIYPDKNWVALTAALATGDKTNLKKEIRSAFSASGSMHLMAVSGFHATLLYIFLSSLLSFMGNYRAMKIFRGVLIIASLWMLAIVAEFTPSATRSVIMLSFYIISNSFSKRGVSINTLFASALIITIVNPQAVYDAGFLLSYTAFASIIFINPIFRDLIKTENKIVRWLWGIVTVSIACQIGTSLISINLFGYFPPYFLLSNILLVPIITLILYAGLVAGIFAVIGIGYDFLIGILNYLSETAILIVTRIESLPHSVIKLDPGPGVEISIAVIIIVFFIEYGISKRVKKYIIVASIINIALCLLL